MATTKAGTQQKRIPKGHAGGGRWTKGGIPPVAANHIVAKNAIVASRNAQALRIKIYKLRRKASSLPKGSDRYKLLDKQIKKFEADYAELNDSAKKLRKTAKSYGFNIDTGGKVKSVGDIVPPDAPEKRRNMPRNIEDDEDALFGAISKSPVVDVLIGAADKPRYSYGMMSDEDRQAVALAAHKKLGYDGKPKIKSNVTEADGDIAYRGIVGEDAVATKKLVDQFKYGEMFMGTGMYTNGTYASNLKATAVSYAGQNSGGVMKLAIPHDYNFVTFKSLVAVIDKYQGNRAKLKQAIMAHPAVKGNAEIANSVFNDMTAYPEFVAMAMGYDGVVKDFENGGRAGETYYVIYNRSKLIVEK